MITVEELENYRIKINKLINENINSLPTNACVNRADFQCNSVEYYLDCFGDSGFKAYFDECSPDCIITANWLLKLLEKNNFIGFNVRLEW